MPVRFGHIGDDPLQSTLKQALLKGSGTILPAFLPELIGKRNEGGGMRMKEIPTQPSILILHPGINI
jgi:hypothetical protein